VILRLFIYCLCSAIYSSCCSAQTIKLQSNSTDQTLPAKVIREVMNELGMSYSYPYENDFDITQKRLSSDLQSGDIDIIWIMTSKEIETSLQAIYVPIYRGTLGMRLAIVKRENKNIFANVHSLDDLKQFSAGQGKSWADTFILEANDLSVAKPLKFSNLFYMLEGNRFDYFPRGFFEPWSEVERFSTLDLVVEPHILLRYTSPMYFFTHKDNDALVAKIHAKLLEKIADGSYQKLFFADKRISDGLSQGQLDKRIIIDLKNPFLTVKTPLKNKVLWYDPSRGQ
jgi:hypothetical protein